MLIAAIIATGVNQVGVDRVGLVLGVEMSRSARSCCDWYQLLDICGLREILLADRDGVCLDMPVSR